MSGRDESGNLESFIFGDTCQVCGDHQVEMGSAPVIYIDKGKLG
jgi:hypothetical protein